MVGKELSSFLVAVRSAFVHEGGPSLDFPRSSRYFGMGVDPLQDFLARNRIELGRARGGFFADGCYGFRRAIPRRRPNPKGRRRSRQTRSRWRFPSDEDHTPAPPQMTVEEVALKQQLAETELSMKHYADAEQDNRAILPFTSRRPLACYQIFTCMMLQGHRVEAQDFLSQLDLGGSPAVLYGNARGLQKETSQSAAGFWV